jgi:hypothetical protein
MLNKALKQQVRAKFSGLNVEERQDLTYRQGSVTFFIYIIVRIHQIFGLGQQDMPFVWHQYQCFIPNALAEGPIRVRPL